MPGVDLAAEALAYAIDELNPYPETIGVTVFCQMVTAPAKNPGNGAKSGPVPIWHIVLTMSNPADLVGPKLRAPYVIGAGAPDKLGIKRIIPEGVAGLRQLGQINLRNAGRPGS